jgi:hypothetical protein
MGGLRRPLSEEDDPAEVGRLCMGGSRKLGAIGDTDLRFKGMTLLDPVSESQSEPLDFNGRLKASDGDKDEIEDWDPLCKLCPLARMTSVHCPRSGVGVLVADRDLGAFPWDAVMSDEELRSNGRGPDFDTG